MKRLIIFLLFIVVTFFSSLAFSGTSYYVDCSARNNGDGSYSSPWNNIASVNDHSFNTGDDVYFKVNTTCTPTNRLKIDWEGTPEDHTTIGAYYGENQFGLNGNARPIIDGSNHTVPPNLSWKAMIQNIPDTNVGDYVDIENLYIKNSGGVGIGLYDVTNVSISNCYIYRSKRVGILFEKVIEGEISENTVNESSYLTQPMAGIAVTGGDEEDTCYNVTVSKNTVFNCYEGIGIYRRVKDTIVEHNAVYDNRIYHIYIDASKNIIVRYNLVYESSGMGPDSARDRLVVIGFENRPYCWLDGNEIYGNMIAGGKVGIELGIDPGSSCAPTNTLIYNNTIVDCQTNFNFRNTNGNWSGNLIKNNISWTITPGDSFHTNDYSPPGVTWGYNNFNNIVSGNAATNAVISEPKLKKTYGWRSISPGSVDGTEWSLQENSINNNAGKPIEGHNDRIYATNYNADTISVNTAIDISPNIGAWMEKGPETNNPAPPEALSIIVK